MEKFRVPPRGASDVSSLAAAGAMAKLAEEYYPLIRGDLGTVRNAAARKGESMAAEPDGQMASPGGGGLRIA